MAVRARLPLPRRRPLAPFFAVIGLSTIPVGVANTVLPLYVLSQGGTAADWGLLFAVGALAMGFGEILAGTLADRAGVRRPLALSRLASVALMGWLASLPGLGLLFIGQGVKGAVDAAIWPLGKGYLGRTILAARKGRYIGLFYMLTGLGNAVGAFLGGWAVEWQGFPAAFLLAAAGSLAAATLAWYGIREARAGEPAPPTATPRAASGAAPGGSQPAGLAEATGPASGPYLWRFLRVAIVTIFLVAGGHAALATLPIVAATVAGLTPAEIGTITASYGVTTVLLSAPLGRVSDRIGRRAAIGAGLVALMLGQAALAWVDTLPTLLATVIVIGVGWSLASPARVALLSEITPAERQGAAMGWLGAFEDVGAMLGGGLAGVLLTNAGRQTTFLGFATAMLVGLAVSAVILRGLRPADRPITPAAPEVAAAPPSPTPVINLGRETVP